MRSEVSVRPANKDDEPFIFSSWLRCYRSSAFASNIPSDVYFSWHHRIVEGLLLRATTLIVHPEGQPTVILGYLCCEPRRNLIHFVSVKKAFRSVGLAHVLIEASGIDLATAQFTHGTPEMSWIINKLPNLKYNPNPNPNPDPQPQP